MVKEEVHVVGFKEFEKKCKELAREISSNKNIKNIYGVPKSGLFPAVRISYLSGKPITFAPNGKETAIIDDCLDSGATRHSFANFPYFFPLIDKQDEHIDKWVDFWWRRGESD